MGAVGAIAGGAIGKQAIGSIVGGALGGITKGGQSDDQGNVLKMLAKLLNQAKGGPGMGQ